MANKHSVSRVSTEADFHAMLDLFQDAFEDDHNYGRPDRPSSDYIRRLLHSETFIGLILPGEGGRAVGALAAYVLHKFEKERSEIYIYDLAVDLASRRQGVATALIEELKSIGRQIGSYVIYVQADKGPEDLPAQALYRKLGTEEDVFHYDIEVAS
ncbi:MAG: GNAT family N-acetyltransferase [Polyangiaceae bacterium]